MFDLLNKNKVRELEASLKISRKLYKIESDYNSIHWDTLLQALDEEIISREQFTQIQQMYGKNVVKYIDKELGIN